MTTHRKIAQLLTGVATTDGAGVTLVRVIGQPDLMDFDPFLLLDAFRSDNPDDYIAGFPSHPHRGFETVTYLLNGRMRHKDNTGNEGVIEPGGVQWMTAGKGIVHSEIPEQKNGLLEGFQLWINLPASHKMTTPAYQEYEATDIPVEVRPGTQVRVIAGETSFGTQGPVSQPLTQPIYLDITLAADTEFSEIIPGTHNAFIYVVKGQVTLDSRNLQRDQLAILGKGQILKLRSHQDGVQILLIAGQPLNEPIARGGPFVMNTRDELQQAFSDYQAGRF